MLVWPGDAVVADDDGGVVTVLTPDEHIDDHPPPVAGVRTGEHGAGDQGGVGGDGREGGQLGVVGVIGAGEVDAQEKLAAAVAESAAGRQQRQHRLQFSVGALPAGDGGVGGRHVREMLALDIAVPAADEVGCRHLPRVHSAHNLDSLVDRKR